MDLSKGKFLDADLTLMARKRKKTFEEQERLEKQIISKPQSSKSTALEADIRLLERTREKKLAQAERMESYISKPVQSVQKSSLAGDVTLLIKKRNQLLKETDRLISQYKPLKTRIEQAQAELTHLETLLIKAQTSIEELRSDKIILEEHTRKYIEDEYRKVREYKRGVLQEVVLVYEALDGRKKTLDAVEAELKRQDEGIAVKRKYIQEREDLADAREADFIERENKIVKDKQTIAETRAVLQSLVEEQNNVTNEAKARSRQVLDSADIVEKRQNDMARILSKKDHKLTLYEKELEAREKVIFDLKKELDIKERNLHDRERALRVNLEQFKKGKL